MRANDGVWIGWPGGTETGLEPFEYDGMQLDPISLIAEEIEGFYEGFSNATLWPLYHDVVAKPEFHREWWDAYVAVNRRFAEHAADRAAKDATVWVHDYQLQLVPQMLRELRPDLHIGFFLHIPFPPAELFQQLPWRRQILEGLLGADLVGFQLPGGAQNFVRLVRQRVGHKTHRDLVYLPDERTVRAAAFPISIDVDRLRGARPLDPRSARAPPRSARRSATRARCSSASTGSTTPRASTPGCARSASWWPTASSTWRTPSSSRWRRPRASGSSSTAILRDDIDRLVGPDQRRLRADRQPGDLLPARVLPARGDGRALPGRRHHGRHALPRRHEPRRQGVRRLPLRRRRRADPLGVRGRGVRAAPGLAGQPLRPQRHEGRAAARRTRPTSRT